MSQDVVRRVSASIMSRKMDVRAALSDCGLTPPPEAIVMP